MNQRLANCILGIILMTIGGGLFYVQSYRVIINAFKSKNWPTVSALVNENYVNAKAGEDNDLYRLNFEAIYSIGGKEYTKVNRYFGSEGSTSWKSDYYEFVDEHPEGSHILLFYNPDKPYEATVKPGVLPNLNFFIIFCSTFFFVGLLFFIGGMRSIIYSVAREPQ